jgi:hypothetical protein
MNYRRGLQRGYAVIAICWIACIAILAATARTPLWAFIQESDWPNLQPGQVQLLRLAWLGGLLVLPPAFGYVVIFVVMPWIFRGFKPGTQI